MKLDLDPVVTCMSSAHAEAVSNLIRSGLQESLAETSEEERTAGLAAYGKEQIIRDMAGRLAYVAVYRQQIIGVILLAQGEGDGRTIEAVCVQPENQGEGIGTLLVQTAENRARELGVKRISVSSSLKNNGFFLRLGYHAGEAGGALEKVLV